MAENLTMPRSFAELTALDGQNLAAAVDVEDAIRTLVQLLQKNLLGVEGEDIGRPFLDKPVDVRVPGSDRKIVQEGRVFPGSPDLRYIKYAVPAIGMAIIGSGGKDEYWANKAKYKVLDPKTGVFRFRYLYATYLRQLQLDGLWRSPIERERMTQQIIQLFQISNGTGRITTLKGSHIFINYLGDRNMDERDDLVDRIYQNSSTWELKVRGFTDKTFGMITGTKITLSEMQPKS